MPPFGRMGTNVNAPHPTTRRIFGRFVRSGSIETVRGVSYRLAG
jgi:hypothetical protein